MFDKIPLPLITIAFIIALEIWADIKLNGFLNSMSIFNMFIFTAIGFILGRRKVTEGGNK